MATSKNRKQQAERLSVIRKLQGDRLNECLEMRGMKPADLAHNYDGEFGVSIPSSHLTMIRKGDRSLPYDYAVAFSDYLEIDSGYLLGSDNFRFGSYDEYVEGLEDIKNSTAVAKKLPMLERYLRYNGYSITAFAPDGDDEGNIEEYQFSLKHGKTIIHISYQELLQFNLDIDEYITLSAQQLFKRHQFDSDLIELR